MASRSTNFIKHKNSLKFSTNTNQIIIPRNNNGTVNMKRKEQHRHVSARQPQFSINGNHRTTPGIGRLHHHTPSHTLFKGNAPRGHGGFKGTYKIKINMGERCFSNDGTVQTSSLNSHSSLQHMHPDVYFGTYPHRWVQHTENNKDNKHYISKLQEKAACLNEDNIKFNKNFDCLGNCIACESTITPVCCDPIDEDALRDSGYYLRTYKPGRQKKYKITNQRHLVKLLRADVIPQSEYVRTRYLRKSNLPTPLNRQHFPTQGYASSCGSSSAFKTWQEAQAAGVLPADYRP